MRSIFIILSTSLVLLSGLLTFLNLGWILFFGPIATLTLIGWMDLLQTKHSIRRNFPLIGWFRYLFEAIRPEINQYFVESNSDGRPFSRDERSLVYQRSKRVLDTVPFGTRLNVYEPGYQWVNHSMRPLHVDPKTLRVLVGGPKCSQPYSASILNISAMSYGSLSAQAIQALNGGALRGGFAHNTGEGGCSPHHLSKGGDLIWQIGTGYFGCRAVDGSFSLEKFKKTVAAPQIKMIEIKISQGAKPGHGGILPGRKVTPEISAIRGVPMGQDVISPPGHSAFSTPIELLEFVQLLREASGGRPIGMKLCVGKRREFLAVAKAMVHTGIMPDYISVDGGEGGTGAAPLEYTDHIGTPGIEGLIFVHNTLVGMGLREQIRVFSSGRITSGFGILRLLALGADVVYAARAFMLSLGCIQALRCNANVCPTGVATNDPALTRGLVVKDKVQRVYSFHEQTILSCAELIGSMGLKSHRDLRPGTLCGEQEVMKLKTTTRLLTLSRQAPFSVRTCPWI